ncbi:phage tail tape measure protein [uncultured Draconibacterium sp.]|uniref:phage tail tape measure protein n=1 Tax=uncultured Draconibacterium sp. TaxID=1573823 RepID=UPI002622FCF9|nr:phage tail tape measure protein [uncultured Draconibacterium sp.]
MAYNEKANVTVTLNNEQARKELQELQGEYKRLYNLKKKAEQAGDVGGWKKIDTEMKKNLKTQNQLKKNYTSIENTLRNLNGANLKDLEQAKRTLIARLKTLKRDSKEWKTEMSNLNKVNTELRKVKTGMGQIQSPTKKLLGFAKGLLPAFGWTAIIAGAIKGAKALFNMYQETAKARREAERLTGLSGKPLADFTASVQATAGTFNKDFSEVLISTNNFAKTMGISAEEALDKINDGFITGADSSDEFLDILKEYGPQFKAAGLSADESIALISQQVKTGIYSDKGIDSIKEATISLREMTPATKAAIDNIGISSNELQAKLRDGSISAFDAIQMISNRLAELPPQSTEVGTAIADIFRGAGEDAGLEYITMLGQAELSLENLKAGAGENALAQERLLEANTKLKQAWGELMGTGTGTFTAIKATATDLLADGIVGLSSGIKNVRDWFIELYNSSLPVRAGFQYMLASWVTGFNIVKTAIQGLWENLKLGGKLIKAVLTFDVKGIKTAFEEYSENTKAAVVANAQKVASTWKSAYEDTINGKIEVRGDITTTPTPVTSVIPDSNNNQEDSTSPTFQRNSESMEEMDSKDPRIEIEESVTETVLEQSKLRQHALDNEQKAAEDRAAVEAQIQAQKKAAYLSTLDTIIGVFGEESRIGKAALLAKQAYAIAETIINISKGTAKTAASAPFPANIPLIAGFVGQVVGLIGTIKSATKSAKGTKEYALGKYPDLIGRLQTGTYGNQPHLGIFNEVPGQPEMVIDGLTLKKLNMNFPEIIASIHAVRDGRQPQMYAGGKYLDDNGINNTASSSDAQNPDIKTLQDSVVKLHHTVEILSKKKHYIAIDMVQKSLQKWEEIETKKGM